MSSKIISKPASQTLSLDPPFDVMLANYELAIKSYVADHKSRHWDVFRGDYDRLIRDTSAWPEFRHNGISDYLDTTIQLSGLPASKNITEPRELAALGMRYKSLAAITGADFIRSCAEAEIGQPRFGDIDGIKLNVPDLRHFFNAWRIQSIRSKFDRFLDHPLIVEIGASYSGLALKLKRLMPSAKIILFDLPEVNAIQTYYLQSAMPDACLLGTRDFAGGDPTALLASEWDFLVLPGWRIVDLPDGVVTLCINARSMMEMRRSVVDFYIREIERLVPSGGAFYCVNRYTNPTFPR